MSSMLSLVSFILLLLIDSFTGLVDTFKYV